MTQPLYVLVYPSPLFAAHWSLWLAHTDASGHESHIGHRIHVTGDRLNGFEYEYIQDYNIQEDERKPKVFTIGLISSTLLESKVQDKVMLTNIDDKVEFYNVFDKVCQQVKPPGPSLNKVNSKSTGNGSQPPPKRTEVKDCQWWIIKVVEHLVEAGMLLPGEATQGPRDPRNIVEELPRH